MEKNVALIGLMVNNFESTAALNEILHEYRENIIGRMGLPYAKSDLSVICIVMDAPLAQVQEMTTRLAAVPNVSVNMMCEPMA